MVKHMTLEEWDRRVAPFLATIGIRARHIVTDAHQIIDWVKLLPAAPDFETEAIAKLEEAKIALSLAHGAVSMALEDYNKKEKVS